MGLFKYTIEGNYYIIIYIDNEILYMNENIEFIATHKSFNFAVLINVQIPNTNHFSNIYDSFKDSDERSNKINNLKSYLIKDIQYERRNYYVCPYNNS